MEVGYKVKTLAHYERSAYQEISIAETRAFGRMLVLDGTPQVTEKDGFIYNEMIAHVALAAHPAPARVAMIGGGDCGPAREAAKYADVRSIDVVEIDARVVEACRAWMSPPSAADDGRVRLIYADGCQWLRGRRREYDVLLVDRSDPYGPAAALYKDAFYRDVWEALADDGIAVFQSGSPFCSPGVLKSTARQLRKRFPVVRTYLCAVPSFPGGIWSFTLASKRWDPLNADLARLQWRGARYVNPDVYRASFVLPNYVRELLEWA